MRRISFHQTYSVPSTWLLVIVALFTIPACNRSTSTDSSDVGLFILNAPAAGEVRRVLVKEDAAVNQGAIVIELAVRQESSETSTPSPQQSPDDSQQKARAAAQSVQSQIAAARAAAERASVEVERMTALVASNDAPQPQLDAARAEYQRAQERLQRTQQNLSLSNAAPPPTPQRGNSAPPNATNIAAPREQLVAVRAPAAGTIRAIGVSIGQRVTAGQPLATIRTNEP
ncbi:MAG: hypothetical protein ABR577_14680 [Pyrinomonadaceae bacterium]